MEVDHLKWPSGRLRREDYNPRLYGVTMATARTGSFYLTETITFPAASASGTRIQGSVDLGAYVNVATGQAIAIDSVDFVFQHGDYNSAARNMVQANGTFTVQLSDLNPGTTFIRADDQSLVASGALNIDHANNIVSSETDLYPDNYGPSALSEMFLVVNDTLYLVAGNNLATTAAAENVYVTARIRARVVKLGSKDWMAIAIQSTASDN